MFWLYVLIFIGSIFLLIFSGKKAVETLAIIARFLRWREFVVAFILGAFTSSLPELFIGITAAVRNVSEISFGNILGANIINLTLALGISVFILGGLEIERATAKRSSILMGIIGFLPLLLILDGDLSRIDGIVLLLALSFYLVWLFDRKELFKKVYNDIDINLLSFKNFFKNLFFFIVSIILLILAAQGIINSVLFFVKYFNISLGIISIILVGFGTALPEIYFSIKAGWAGEKKMILGNLMGCVVITSTLVLGIVSLISPIVITDFSPYALSRIFLLITILFFLYIIKSKNKISKKEALVLISFYILFLVFLKIY